MNVLLLNAGSSSLKATLISVVTAESIAYAHAEWGRATTSYHFCKQGDSPIESNVSWSGHAEAVRQFLTDLSKVQLPVSAETVAAVGHRVVHGGAFTASVLIDQSVHGQIEALNAIAPLHNPPALAAIDAAQQALPNVPHIAVFDTAFHATLPQRAWMYPVPRDWYQRWGIRRYGFHGLSFSYCAERSAELLGRPISELRILVCHLGNGCSAAAIVGGRSIDTTMGFTPLDGLMMGTRSGAVDPGILLHLQLEHGMSASELFQALNKQSGLLGVSGISGDMREVSQAATDGDDNAKLALEVYVYRIRQAIGALSASMGGLDCLVFTAGVGEHSAEVRRAVCAEFEYLGIVLDPEKNAQCTPDVDVSAPGSKVRVLVVQTREELTMLSEVLAIQSSKSSFPETRLPTRS